MIGDGGFGFAAEALRIAASEFAAFAAFAGPP